MTTRARQQAMGMMGMHGMAQHPDMHAVASNDSDNATRAPRQHCIDDTEQCKQLNQLTDMQQHMAQRMNMMQMMMQQMLEHEAASEQDEDN